MYHHFYLSIRKKGKKEPLLGTLWHLEPTVIMCLYFIYVCLPTYVAISNNLGTLRSDMLRRNVYFVLIIYFIISIFFSYYQFTKYRIIISVDSCYSCWGDPNINIVIIIMHFHLFLLKMSTNELTWIISNWCWVS